MLTAMGMYRTVGLVGLGRMGQTLARGFARAVGPGHVFVCGRSERLVVQSLHAVDQLVERGSTLAEIVDRVAVPGGNTAAAIEAAEGSLGAAWRAAFEATAHNEGSKPIPQLLPAR